MTCENFDRWPLMRGDTLSNHDWFPVYFHRLLSSSFVMTAVMTDRRGDIGTAIILWCEAMRQDPAGTLPMDDMQLAGLAKFASVEAWQAVRDGALHGWVPVLVEDGASGETEVRLGNPRFLQGVVEEMHRRKVGRNGSRVAAAQGVRKSRIKAKMVEMKVPKHMTEDDRVLGSLVAYFEQSNLYITAENVLAAMVTVLGYTGQVVRFPGSDDGVGAGGRR